ncbi:hypothetical protein [Streptomyces hyaluromycini]|uniref:hypothetical protein n=1 Tax=Streptomyces hyaluromycini TaxID=1377993 RepID=UPI00123809AA|nr:hypothetical protein [Streptomyces hyaluromycini]
MSGFARDTKYYGDRLVYEPLQSKWDRYHATHCGCGQDLTAHAVPAGFTVIPRGTSGYYGLVGPGLTEGVDESALTANALWEAVTGKPGAQTWYESVHVTCRSPEAEARRKAENERVYGPRREQAAKAKTEPATAAQLKYLATLRRRRTGSGSTPRSPRRSRAPGSRRVSPASGPRRLRTG